MSTLTLHDGSTLSFTDAELSAIWTRLEAQNQSYCLGASDTARVKVGPSLLIMDVGWITGRKLIEMYGITYDSTFPFGLKFTVGQGTYTLNQALAGAGYVGLQTITALSQVYMLMYISAAQVYLASTSNLVKDSGAFSTTPA